MRVHEPTVFIDILYLTEVDSRGAQPASATPFFRLSKSFFSEQLLLLLQLLRLHSIIDDIVQNGAPLLLFSP